LSYKYYLDEDEQESCTGCADDECDCADVDLDFSDHDDYEVCYDYETGRLDVVR